MNEAQERVFSYLQQCIGRMKVGEVQRFLRFVTGSTVMSDTIKVEFNTLSGFGQRPISHTCSFTLELSSEYH